jgi:hypothetical protein
MPEENAFRSKLAGVILDVREVNRSLIWDTAEGREMRSAMSGLRSLVRLFDGKDLSYIRDQGDRILDEVRGHLETSAAAMLPKPEYHRTRELANEVDTGFRAAFVEELVRILRNE